MAENEGKKKHGPTTSAGASIETIRLKRGLAQMLKGGVIMAGTFIFLVGKVLETLLGIS